MLIRIGLLLGIVCAATAAFAETTTTAAPPRATMHRVFQAVAVLLPLSTDAQRFAAPENQETISREIQALAGAARELENHGAGRDRSFQFLSRSLASDVEEIRHRYDWGRLEEARFFVLESTRNCVACHSRLPSHGDFPLGDRLLDKIDMASLSHHERSQLYVVTRQFERALDNWEELFGEWLVSPGQLDAGGYLHDYLTVAIRVEGSYSRARKTLEALRKRANVPEYMQEQLDAWIVDLGRFEKASKAPADLPAIRKIVDGAPKGEANSAVSDLVASAELLRFIDQHARSGPDSLLAEAYYLLGVVESRTAESFWVPQAPFHLEIAIRLDPDSPNADSALALLEEQFAIGYGAIDAEVLPMDLWTKLEELRKLVGPTDS